MSSLKRTRKKPRSVSRDRTPRAPARPRFVGRDASPVLDRYPPKEGSPAPRPTTGAVPAASPAPPPPSVTAPKAAATPTGPSNPPLITLDRPFDVDEFAALLGETSIRVTVPREALPEVLHRVLEFMGFGIYVYTISVRPAPAELLKSFVVELRRVDYSAESGAWVPFVEKGTTPSPFGPSGDRT